jgi:hypothetical protein
VVVGEYWAATDLRRELVKEGATVVGPAPSLEMAMDPIGSAARIDAAILDINLAGEMVFPVADRPREQGVPFLFTTGYDQSVIPPRFGGVLRCEKPVSSEGLGQSLATLILYVA